MHKYSAVVFPAGLEEEDQDLQEVEAFIKNGGAVLFCADSFVDPDGKFKISCGLDFKGKSECDVDYVRRGSELAEGLVDTPVLFYSSSYKVMTDGASSIAQVYAPYFNRTNRRYCSHQYTPYSIEPTEYPAAAKYGKVVYLAHDCGSQYFAHGMQFCKDYVFNALRLIYNEPVLTVKNMPSAGRVRLAENDKYYVLHLTYAQPIQRGDTLVIEDLPDIHNVTVNFKTKYKIKSARLIPQNMEIPVKCKNGEVFCTVDSFSCHQIVAFLKE